MQKSLAVLCGRIGCSIRVMTATATGRYLILKPIRDGTLRCELSKYETWFVPHLVSRETLEDGTMIIVRCSVGSFVMANAVRLDWGMPLGRLCQQRTAKQSHVRVLPYQR